MTASADIASDLVPTLEISFVYDGELPEPKLQALRELIENSPQFVGGSEPWVAYFHQGHFLSFRGNLVFAAKSYMQAIRQKTDFAEAYYHLGNIYLISWECSQKLEVLVEAAKCFHQAATLKPDLAEAFYQLGNAGERLSLSNVAECWNKAIVLKPDFAEAYLKLANHLFWRHGKIKEGIEFFEKTLQLKPDWVEAYETVHFYMKYAEGSLDPQIDQHTKRGKQRVCERAIAHQLNHLHLRVLSGITQHLGHYAYLDTFAKAKALGWLPDLQFIMLAPESKIANPCLLRYWQPYIPTFSDPLVLKCLSPLAKFLEAEYSEIRSYQEISGGDDFKMIAEIQKRWEEEKRPPLLQLGDQEKERGWQCLERLGVPRRSWFVALHVRDDGFKGPDQAQGLRNADVLTYLPAIESIVAAGGWVIRMGDPKMRPLPAMKQAIDYARSEAKSDWMDVFLWSQSRFFIGGNSGPSWIPHTFGVPCVRTNWSPITRVPWSGSDLMIPKLFRRRQDGRLLTFREIVDPRGAVEWTHSAEALKARGIEPIDNTPEELRDVAMEMLERLEGSRFPSSEENELQERFASLVRDTCAGFGQNDRTSRLGGKFLRNYIKLLD